MTLLKDYFGRTALALLTTAVMLGAAHAETRDFYIVTVHYDGKTNVNGDATHKPEAFPEAALPSSKGMWVKGPKDNGDWQVRTFVFDPAEVTVEVGDDVNLHFVGVHGGSHTVTVEGAEPIVVKRGTSQTVSFKAQTPGIVSFVCNDHPPSMRGQVVVLSKQ